MIKFKFRTYLIFTLLWLAMILLQSFLPSGASYAESSGFLAIVQSVLPWITHSVLRRAAHFIEFALLGVFSTGMFCNARHFTLFKPMFFTLLSAVCDESVKIFASGRTPQISDIWLDFLGAMTGILLMWLISRLHKQ